jgi:hypothetical protein
VTRRKVLCLPAIPLFAPVGSGLSQATAAPSACADSISKTVAFLQGGWTGQSFSVGGRDTTRDATMQIWSESLYGGCVLKERWEAEHEGKRLFQAQVVRAYDGPTRRWLVYYADDQLNSQFYEGKHEGGYWRFIRSRMDGNTPILVRLTWKPTATGYEQLIERSRDAGKTWILGGFVKYDRVASR